jgi:acetolactate synthase-1/3 small subunit
MLRNYIARRYSSSSSLSALVYKTIKQSRKGPSPLPVIETPRWTTADSAIACILTEQPAPAILATQQKPYIFNCLVQNEPGVLSLISGKLAGRGFNIDSLVVAHTELPTLSRMTIVLPTTTSKGTIEQVRKQIEDLVPVWSVLDYTNVPSIKREILLAKVSLLGPEYFAELIAFHEGKTVTPGQSTLTKLHRSEWLRMRHANLDHLTNVVKVFGGSIADIAEYSCVVELCAKPERVSALLELIKPFGVLELARTGMTTLARTPLDPVVPLGDEFSEKDALVDASTLPPG